MIILESSEYPLLHLEVEYFLPQGYSRLPVSTGTIERTRSLNSAILGVTSQYYTWVLTWQGGHDQWDILNGMIAVSEASLVNPPFKRHLFYLDDLEQAMVEVTRSRRLATGQTSSVYLTNLVKYYAQFGVTMLPGGFTWSATSDPSLLEFTLELTEIERLTL